MNIDNIATQINKSFNHDIVINLSLVEHKENEYQSLLLELMNLSGNLKQKVNSEYDLSVLIIGYEGNIIINKKVTLKYIYKKKSDTPKIDFQVYFIKDAADHRKLYYLFYETDFPQIVTTNYYEFLEKEFTNENFNYSQQLLAITKEFKLKKNSSQINFRVTEFKIDFDKGEWIINEDAIL